VSDPEWQFECGDGLNGMLGLSAVDHTFTDVPFSARVDENHAAEGVRDPGEFDFEPMTPELLDRASRVIAAKTRRWALVITDYEEGVPAWKAALENCGMKFWATGHFRKSNPKPLMRGVGPAQPNEAVVICHGAHLEQRWNGGGKPAEWTAAVVKGLERCHPTQKPTMLLRQLIEDFSDPGELIADPFGGVATTGVAAVACGRRFWGAELKPHYHALGIQRLSMPLFDPRPEQRSLLEDHEPKGHVSRARMELERYILDFVRSSNGEGVNISMLASALPNANDKELQRILAKLVKTKALHKTGKTASTRYHALGQGTL
jgi:site-specific DNA-methyltransferase (adenine-specific)